MRTVSVVMSVYNAEQYLRQAVDSILNQTFQDFEFVIIDDGSTDSSLEIIRSYRDTRIILETQSNVGLTRSLNRGIKLASGRYIARQDADDLSEPHRLEKQLEVLESDKRVVLASSNLRYFSEAWTSATESNRDVPAPLVRWLLLFYNHVGGHSQVIFRKDVAQRLGGYDETIRYSQDYDLWLRMSEAGEIVILPDVLLNFRHHASNLSRTAAEEQLQQSVANSIRAIEKRAGVTFTADDIKLLRRFWLKSGGELTSAEAAHVSSTLVKVMDGSRTRGTLSSDDASVISKLVATFFDLNAAECKSPHASNMLASLAEGWAEKGSFLSPVSSKFI